MSAPDPPRKDARSRARDAAWEILLAGDRPTQRNIIDRMGGGSPNTVNDVLKDFWREIGNRLQRPSIPEPIVQTVDDLWSAALAEAHRTQQQYRESADAQIDAARKEMLGARRKLSTTESSLETERQETAALRTRITTLSADLASTTAHLEEIRRRAELAEAHAGELKRVLDERDRSHEEALARERDAAKALEDGFRQQIEDMAATLSEAKQRTNTLETEERVRKEEQQKRNQALEERLGDLQKQLESRNEELKVTRSKAETLRENLRVADQARQSAEIETERIKTRLELFDTDRSVLQKQVASLERESGELLARLNDERERYETEREKLTEIAIKERERAKNLEDALKHRNEEPNRGRGPKPRD